jgi:hypothetical protein
MSNSKMTGNTTVFVGNAAPGTTYTSGTCTEASVAVIYEDGTAVTGALSSTSNAVRIISKKNGVMKYSPFFKYADILTKTKTAYSAAAEQVTYLGYNGTGGSFDGTSSATISSSTIYMLVLELTNFSQYAKSPFICDIPFYTTTTSQTDLAVGLQKGAITRASLQNPVQVVCEKVCSGTDVGNTTGSWTVVNGSSYATVSSATGLTVGQIIRCGATGAATTVPVYEIMNISGTTIQLDNNFQGTSAATQTYCSVTTPGQFGLKFTGQAVSTITKDAQWEPVTFKVYMSNKTTNVATGATITNSTAQSIGTGNWKAVLQLERVYSYGLGQSYVSALPLESPNTVASSSYTYDCIYISSEISTSLDKGKTGTVKKPTIDIYIFTDSSLVYNNSNGYHLGTIFGL